MSRNIRLTCCLHCVYVRLYLGVCCNGELPLSTLPPDAAGGGGLQPGGQRGLQVPGGDVGQSGASPLLHQCLSGLQRPQVVEGRITTQRTNGAEAAEELNIVSVCICVCVLALQGPGDLPPVGPVPAVLQLFPGKQLEEAHLVTQVITSSVTWSRGLGIPSPFPVFLFLRRSLVGRASNRSRVSEDDLDRLGAATSLMQVDDSVTR